jgi:hypothetical protein
MTTLLIPRLPKENTAQKNSHNLQSGSSSCQSSEIKMKLFLLCMLSLPSLGQSYVTWIGAVPPQKQIPWLHKLTGDICESATLSDEMIQAVPHVMKGWATARQYSAENAVEIERLVKRLVDESEAGNTKATPHTDDYNCMLEGWARSGEGVFAAERCEQILTAMQGLYEEGDANVQPDLSSFKVAIMAWRQCQTDYSAGRAQRVLEWMVELHQEEKNDLALPDSDCFDIVLQSWARNRLPDAPKRAEKLLGVMEELYQATELPRLRPRTLSFNAVLSAWGKSKDEDAWKRSLDILSFMEKLHSIEKNDRVAPDIVTYHIVLGALAKSGNAKAVAPKAGAIIRSIEKQHKAGTLTWKPDTILFNSAIGLYAKSSTTKAYRKARSLLDRQLNMFHDGCEECRPDVVGFTSVISSCASDPGDRAEKLKAFNVALSTYQQLVSGNFGEPNHVTYGTMLKACARLLPPGCPERSKWTKQIFEDCVTKGLVGDMVLGKLREAATNAEYKALMQGHSRRNIPASWSYNVDEKSDYRRKIRDNNRRRAAV